MTTRAKLETKGFAEYLERIVQAGLDVDQVSDQALQAGGEVLLSGMQRRVAKDTHNLEKHLTVDGPHQDGNFHYIEVGLSKKADAETLVRSHFESIPRRPAPPVSVPRLTRNLRASWDVEASAIYYIAPGPYNDYRERLILTLFGSFLNQYMNSSPSLYGGNQLVYCTNQVYRVAAVPFFVYGQPAAGHSVAEVGPLLLQHLEGAMQLLDEDSRVDGIKASATSFMTSTMLKPDKPDYPMSHHQVIGQEALNVGIRHLLREGRTSDEFVAEVNAITPDQFRSVVKSRLARSSLYEVSFQPAH